MLEEQLWSRGYRFVAGIDEAGRGCLAGPLVAACVMFRAGSDLTGYRDSKTIRPALRDTLFHQVLNTALSIGIGMADERFIDLIGIQQANRYVFREALSRMNGSPRPDFVIFDWLDVPGLDIPSIAPSRAESRSSSVAAASIVAKVWRDRILCDWYHPKYPHYGFPAHKGYGTRFHREQIIEWGLSQAHRRTFCETIAHLSSVRRQRGAGSQAVYSETPENENPRNQLPFLYR